MEFLEFLADLFVALDGLTVIADVFSWIKGRANRIERREARRRGEVVPPRNGWNKAVIFLTWIAVALSAYIAWRLRS